VLITLAAKNERGQSALSDRGGYSGLPHVEGLAAQDAMVLAVVRWRLPLKLAVWLARKRCAEPADRKPCIFSVAEHPFQVERAGPADHGRPTGARAHGHLSIGGRGCPMRCAARLVREVTGCGMSGDTANWQYGGSVPDVAGRAEPAIALRGSR
jgi:hypothetical protein